MVKNQSLNELFEQRLLRKIPIDIDKVSKSLEMADKFLKDAENLLRKKIFNFVILAAYSSMFHSSRALLYNKGIQEKSHYAVMIYLKEKYSGVLGNLIFEFSSARKQRHQGLYGLDYEFEEEDCEHIISVAKEFNKKIKQILYSK